MRERREGSWKKARISVREMERSRIEREEVRLKRRGKEKGMRENIGRVCAKVMKERRECCFSGER